MSDFVEASAPARIDLSGGTLDLWPLHVLHPGSITVNLAIDRRARVRVRRGREGFVVRSDSLEVRGRDAEAILREPRAALVGSLLAALEVREPLEIDIVSGVPFGSGLGGSSAIAVALLGALERSGTRDLSGVDRVDFIRDVETRVLGKPAGVQDYFPPLSGGIHAIDFLPGRTLGRRQSIDAEVWAPHLVLYDTGASHSSGMNNWEVLRARLEGEPFIAERLEQVRAASARMARAVWEGDFEAMGSALGEEWEARRRLAPIVSTPGIEAAVAAAMRAGAWAGKACGAGGGGCVVFLTPPERWEAVRKALTALGTGALLETLPENEGLAVSA